MKKYISLFYCVLLCCGLCAQTSMYDENVNAMNQISQAVEQAKLSQKYVLCQVGGNWCPWCICFAHFADTNATVNKIIKDNFVYIHVNYSRENKNPEAMKYLGNPARFGFPVFVILNGDGKPIHIQNSAYLEKDKSYSEKLVSDFLLNWTPAAVNTLK